MIKTMEIAPYVMAPDLAMYLRDNFVKFYFSDVSGGGRYCHPEELRKLILDYLLSD